MRLLTSQVFHLATFLLVFNLIACTKSGDSGSENTQTTNQRADQGSSPVSAEALNTESLERRIRESFLVTLGYFCETNLKKVATKGSAVLTYDASISCEHRPGYNPQAPNDIGIDEFFSVIDTLRADLSALNIRGDATSDHQLMVKALEHALSTGDGKALIDVKNGYEKDLRARKAMLAKLNMKITRHPYVYPKPSHDTIEWIDGASHDVSLAQGVAQICIIQPARPAWSGESVWLTKSDRYTTARLAARRAAELVFASIGADNTFTPAGLSSMWSMTAPKDFLSSFFWYDAGSLFCPDQKGPVELDKMVNAIKSGEFASQWAALPTLSGYSVISLNGAYAPGGVPEVGKVLGGTMISMQSISPPVDGREFGVALTLRIPHKMPSRALELAAATARITFDASVEAMRIRGDYMRAIREAAPNRKDYPNWTAISFASMTSDKKFNYADEFVKDVEAARKNFAVKEKWLDQFVNWDTKDGANDPSFSDCRRGNYLPRIVFDTSRARSIIVCGGTQPVYYVHE